MLQRSVKMMIGVRASSFSRGRAFLSSTATKLSLSFAAPHTSLYYKEPVDSVTLPGASGEYGVTAGHSRVVDELKPGVVSVVTGSSITKYFVSGGFAFTDPEATEVSVAEAVNVEDLDPDKVKAAYAKAKADGDDLEMETAKSMATALGIAV